jgi:hypothetical protein
LLPQTLDPCDVVRLADHASLATMNARADDLLEAPGWIPPAGRSTHLPQADAGGEEADAGAALIEALVEIADSVDGLAKRLGQLEQKVEALAQLFAGYRAGAE